MICDCCDFVIAIYSGVGALNGMLRRGKKVIDRDLWRKLQ